MAVDYIVELNGTDYRRMVERDSYQTFRTPVFSDAVTTFDKITHKVLVRMRGGLTISLNPQTAEDTRALCEELARCPVVVKYHCLQRDIDVYANMAPDTQSAQFLSRCRARGYRWNDLAAITLEEL